VTQTHRIDEALQERLACGLLNYWYPVLPSWAVTTRPAGITRLGQNVVVWRAPDGEVHALEDRCPHRGARLSMGWNLGDRIACWYHGVQVTAEGVVAEVPAVERCPMVGEKLVKRYPTREIQGAVFLYFGDELNEMPVPLEVPEQLSNSDVYEAILCVAKWKCNYRLAIDNVMDPMHGTYLHADSHSMACGDKQAQMGSRTTDTGFIFEKKQQRGVNFDWVEWGESGAMWMRLEIPYGKSAGPGGDFGIIGMVCPVDAAHTMAFFWRYRRVTGWQRDLWRFMYRTKLEKLHWEVLEQDRRILENLAPNSTQHEFLYQHDVGLGRARRILEHKARLQLEAVAAHKPGAGPMNSASA